MGQPGHLAVLSGQGHGPAAAQERGGAGSQHETGEGSAELEQGKESEGRERVWAPWGFFLDP